MQSPCMIGCLRSVLALAARRFYAFGSGPSSRMHRAIRQEHWHHRIRQACTRKLWKCVTTDTV
eukprot:8294697-Heterocapsa_arctica.AAC.1